MRIFGKSIRLQYPLLFAYAINEIAERSAHSSSLLLWWRVSLYAVLVSSFDSDILSFISFLLHATSRFRGLLQTAYINLSFRAKMPMP
jgi:hypothetical protein